MDYLLRLGIVTLCTILSISAVSISCSGMSLWVSIFILYYKLEVIILVKLIHNIELILVALKTAEILTRINILCKSNRNS